MALKVGTRLGSYEGLAAIGAGGAPAAAATSDVEEQPRVGVGPHEP